MKKELDQPTLSINVCGDLNAYKLLDKNKYGGHGNNHLDSKSLENTTLIYVTNVNIIYVWQKITKKDW